MHLLSNRTAGSWITLIVSTIIVTVISLSIHVVMLQVLGVPFPDRSGVSVWAAFLNVLLAVAAFSAFYSLARPRLTAFPTWQRWLIMAALFGTLKEVFRGSLMNGVVTTAWVFSFAQLIGPIVYSLVLSALVVVIVPRIRGPGKWFAAMVVIAAFMMFAVKPLTNLILAPLMEAISPLNHADVYPFPYGRHVLFWAYVTYLEPVIACFVAAALALPGLSSRPVVRTAQFTLVILCIKGALLPTILFGFTNKLGLWTGIAAESQFMLEGLALAVLVAVIWPVVSPPNRIL